MGIPLSIGVMQINVRLNGQTWDELMKLKQRSGNTSLVGSWYRALVPDLFRIRIQLNLHKSGSGVLHQSK